MKKTILTLNLILASLTIVADMLYTTEVRELWMKGVASALFLTLGITNLIFAIKNKANLKFSIAMVIGLAVTMLADIILNLHFISGALIFALGHICYFIAYCYLIRFNFKDLIPAVCIFIPSTLIITLVPAFDFGGVLMEIICIIYALIISCMVGKTISNLIQKRTLSNIIITIGSMLFFISDLMLLIDQFSNAPRLFGVLCLATYYPAQILLAYSIYHNTLDLT